MTIAWKGIKKLQYKCADGYKLSADKTQCLAYQDAVKAPGDILAQHFTDAQYGWDGIIFYKSGNVNIDGTWDITAAQSLLPDIWSRNPQTFFPNANYTSYTSGLFIKAFNINDTTSGIMNACSIWKQADQNFIGTLGFTRTINVSTASTYYLGFGADNYCTIKVNGTTILQQDVEKIESADYLPHSTSNQYESSSIYTYWQVIPISLNAGDNEVEILVTNTSGPGSIAAEIYNGTLAQIQACTTQADLTTLTIFSTRTVNDGDAFDLGTWQCASGWDLTTDANGYPICSKTGSPPVKFQ